MWCPESQQNLDTKPGDMPGFGQAGILVVERGRVVLLKLLSFVLGVGNRPIWMVRRRVDGVHREAFLRRGINNVVNSSCGYDHYIAILHRDLIAIGNDFSFTSLKSEELVNVIVHFLANIFIGFKGH